VFYSILKKKDVETYKRMFQIINKESEKGMCNKKFLMGDFEVNSFNFLLEYNKEIQIKNCYFHFTKCILDRKKECSKGLIYGMKALPLAPPTEIGRNDKIFGREIL